MMSSHLEITREGHREQLYHVFSYLNKYHNSELVLDPSDQVIGQDEFERQYWTSSNFGHVSVKEDLPQNMPDLRGFRFYGYSKC